MPDWKEQKLKAGEVPNNLKNYEVIQHRIGNQTNAEENNNKFFSLELWKNNSDWYVYSNYGRVSTDEYTGVGGLYGPGTEHEAKSFFESKFNSKVRPSKGYIEISFIKAKVGSPKARLKSYKVSEDEIPEEKKKKLTESNTNKIVKPKIDIHPVIKKLVEQWYREAGSAITKNAAIEITSDGLMTPLGVLSFSTVDRGRKILGQIAEAIKNNDDKELRKLTGAFFSVIPTSLGRKIEDSDIISTDSIVQQKLDLLDNMDSALEVGGKTFNSETDNKFSELGITAEYLEKSDPEYIRLEKKVRETRASNHSHLKVKVRNIIKVTLNADSNRYGLCKVNNELELWHGSRNSNILGILKRGLLIAPPEAPVSGYMFDKGLYFADASTKSLNYSLYPFPNMTYTDNCFLFVMNVKLGKIKELQDADYSASRYIKKDQFNSVKGCKGRSLYNNEFIIYELSQNKASYIIELER